MRRILTTAAFLALAIGSAQAANSNYYLAYYDGAYGKIIDGYWGMGDKFWYEDRGEHWHADDASHFTHDPKDGSTAFQGTGLPREH